MDQVIAKSIRRHKEKQERDSFAGVHTRIDRVEDKLNQILFATFGAFLTLVIGILLIVFKKI